MACVGIGFSILRVFEGERDPGTLDPLLTYFSCLSSGEVRVYPHLVFCFVGLMASSNIAEAHLDSFLVLGWHLEGIGLSQKWKSLLQARRLLQSLLVCRDLETFTLPNPSKTTMFAIF